MTRRYVTLGDGRKIGLGRYVEAWRECLRLVRTGKGAANIGKGIGGWGETAAEALDKLRDGMDDRINRNDPAYLKGRKWSWDWQRDMQNAAWRLNNRIVIDWLPPELKGRFGYRLRTAEEW